MSSRCGGRFSRPLVHFWVLLALTVAAPPAAAQAVDGHFLVVTPIALSVGVLRWPSLRGWWRAVTRRQVSG